MLEDRLTALVVDLKNWFPKEAETHRLRVERTESSFDPGINGQSHPRVTPSIPMEVNFTVCK
jgi:hypothetical protein